MTHIWTVDLKNDHLSLSLHLKQISTPYQFNKQNPESKFLYTPIFAGSTNIIFLIFEK